MFAHVLALCFILRLLKRSNHYAPNFNLRLVKLSVQHTITSQRKGCVKCERAERVKFLIRST